MTDEFQPRPEFPRGFFGYRRRDVDVAFAEWRMLLRQLRQGLESAESRAGTAEAELKSVRAEVQELRIRETELSRIAIGAQKQADEIVRRAEVEADETERAAENRAREIVAAAASRAREITTAAEESAATMRLEVSRRSNEMSAEIDELVRLRESLRTSVRALTYEMEQALARVERGEVAAAVRPAEPAVAPWQQASPLAAAPAPAEGALLFDTHVEVEAGPFPDFAALSTFERALARVPKVQDVYIRRFADERATIEVTLSERAALVDGLQGVLPHSFEVVDAQARSLKLEVVAPLAVGW